MKERRLTFKRVLSQLLALVMVFSMLPELHLHAHATTVTVLDGQVSVADTASTLSGTAASMTATAKGSLFSKATNTITITNTSGAKAEISAGYSVGSANSFTIDGASAAASGTITKQLDAGGTIVFYIQSKSGLSGTTVTLTLSNLTIKEVAASSTVTFQYDSSLGSVTVAGTAVASGGTADIESSGAALVATANSGVSFLGWTDGDGKILSTATSYTLTPASDMTVKAAFAKDGGTPWFGVGSAAQKSVSSGLLGMSKLYYYTVGTSYLFDNLNTAATYAAEHSTKVVVLMNSGTLSAGTYTIPSGVTLLIPFDTANTMYTTQVQSVDSYTAPTAYRTLTLADGANLVINGAMSLSAKHHYVNADGNKTPAAGAAPTGSVSFVKMQGESNMTVNSGGVLYAYGFVTGSGSVTVNSGATVYEMFQIADFRGGTQSTDMDNGVFPISQYYVQNIEVPMTLYSGAKEYSYTTVYMSSADFGSSVAFISNSDAMFNLTSGYVVKKYDGSRDRLVVELHGNMTMSPVELTIGTTGLNSKDYDLGINGNITLTVKSGSMVTIEQDLAFLPGSEILVEEGSTCTLASGINVYIYDADQWGNYIFGSTGPVAYKFIPVIYAPGRTYNRTEADMVDAKIVVNGTMDASAGYVYTTESGANITSAGGGVVIVGTSGTQTVTHQLQQIEAKYYEIPITPAKLKNADGITPTYTTTASDADTFTYIDGRWTCGTHNETTVAAKDSTCTETGLTEGKQCADCGTVTVAQTEVAKLDHSYGDDNVCDNGCGKTKCDNNGHTEVTDAAVAPTCTATGLTEGKHCSVCGTVTVAQTEVAATGHTEVTDAAVAPTCTATGLTEGKHCSVCGTVTVAQTEVAKLDHSYGDDNVCDNGCGKTKCDHNGHTEVVDAAVAPTCTETGLTEGKHCSVCGTVTVAQTEVAATGHSYTKSVTAPTCTEKGYTTHTCSVCGNSYTDTYKNETGHSYKYDCDKTCFTCKEETRPDAEHIDGGDSSPHYCDYLCGTELSKCEDNNGDHKCDVCEVPLTTCVDKNTDHVCDNNSACTVYSTGKNSHNDSATDKDHVCDYCGGEIENGETCSDVTTDQDHNCDVCGEVLTTEHTWTLDKYEWSDNGKTCTAHGKCDCGVTTTANGSISSQVKTAATCTVMGTTTYTATFTGVTWASTQTKDVQDILATGHKWSVSYSWTEVEGGWECKATHTCANSASCTETATATVTSEAAPAATCTETGDTQYTATFGVTWAKNQTKTVEGDIAAKGHTFDEIVAAKDATCLAAGNEAYKYCSVCKLYFAADAAVNSTASKDDAIDFAIARKDHSYTGAIKSDGNDKSATHSFKCVNGCDGYGAAVKHTWNEGEVTTAPGCESEGVKTYTCTAEGCGATYTESIAATGHNYSTVVTKPTCTEGGYTTYTCNCGDTYTADKVAALGHEDDDYDHVCDNGCGVYQGTHEDVGKDHKCDYGCLVAIGDCADTNKDHACDYGCTKYHGTHADTNKDHACDYGCSVAIGTCVDADKDHKCDHGCSKVYGEHKDVNPRDHKCDYGCSVAIGTCEDADTDHKCDHGCGKDYGTHEDTDKNHACDYGCKEPIGICEDADDDKDHYCDYGAESVTGCRAYFGTHADSDTDKDHVCDYGCGAVLTTCSDKTGDEDHNCDVCGKEDVTEHTYSNATCEVPSTCSECGATTGDPLGHIDENTDHICDRKCGKTDMGEHKDDNTDHACDYGCSESIGTCADADKDHDCDYGCNQYHGEHADANFDHVCDYGCSESIGTCADNDKDHDCDYGCDQYHGEHADANFDHVCDYGCKEAIGTCEDADEDHYCDYGAKSDTGCRDYFGTHEDSETDKDHVCDYCGGEIENGEICSDVTTDKDHNCDVCGKENITQHIYGEVTYTWTEDGKSCTASRSCNCSDTQKATAEITYEVKTAATCTEMGTTTYTATFSEEWAETRKMDVVDIPEKGHSYTSVVTEPTCTAGGYTTHTCSECGDTYADNPTEAKGHSYESVVTDPTCTVDGYTTYTCSVCKDSYTDDVVSATGHSYGDVTFSWNADNTKCTASHGCKNCDHSESVTADASSAITTTATCTVKQVTTYTAVFEAAWIDEEARTQTKDVEGATAPDNHTQKCTYTINENGTHTKTYPCCGKAFTEGHTYNEGVCACDKVQTFTITWVNGNTTTTTTVEYGKVPEAPGTDKTGELTKAPDNDYHYTFDSWGEVDEALADATYTAVYIGNKHDYSSNCKVCSVCNYSGDGTRAHKVGNPTCTEDAVCEVCETVVNKAYGHLFTYDANKCHWSTDEDGNHVYHFVASCSRENICDEIEEITVTAVQQDEGYKAPTCTADGSANYVATIPSGVEQSWALELIHNGSNTVSKVFAIEKLGHSLTETAAQAATCTEAGTLGYWTCGRCSVVFGDAVATTVTSAEARKLNALGHDWKCTENGTITCNRDGCTATTTENIDTAHTWVSKGETPATCTTAGAHAGRTCSVCGKVEGGGTISALGHNYGETSYAWTQDEETGKWICTATHTCGRDGCAETQTGHTETTQATVSSKVTTESTCTVMGYTTYTAKFDVNWATEQVQTLQDVKLAEHTPDEGIITKSPFFNKEGERTFHCTKCNAVTGTAVEPATGKIHISVLGDSITAFENYSNGTAADTTNSTLAGGRVWFPMVGREFDSEGNPIDGKQGEITKAEHIWIYQAAEKLGANILVNNSWSGSAVHFWQYGAPGMWQDRAVQLHDNTGLNNGQEPDIIVVYMGTNDFKYTELVNGTYAQIEDGSYYKSVLGTYEAVDFDALITKNEDGTFTYAKPANTMEAYAISFHKMKQRYPNSEIYVMTLLPFRAGIHQPTDFNEDIRQMAKRFGVTVVDIEDTGIVSDEKNFEYLMEDWLHPNLKGMEVLANAFESAVRNKSALYLDDFVNVSYDIGDGVTAMEGTTRAVVAGKDFDASLKLNDQTLIMQVTVLRNGVDITNTCMTEVDDPNTKLGGKIVNIHIDDVAKGDVIQITAKAHKHEYDGVVTAPTCTEAGFTTYTCACGDTYKANEVAATGHRYTELSDKLATEATCTENATYYAKCANCGDVHTTNTFEKENTKLGHSYTTKASEKEASAVTCTNPARYYVQCDRCDAVSTEKTVSVGDALGHNYADATYDWTYDATNSTWICTAKRVCNRDAKHVETVEATVTSEEKQAATCTEKGWTTYTATFDVAWAAKQTQDVEDIAALGHAYGEPTYEWTNGNKNCTAKRVCDHDAKHVETVEATVTSVVKTPATCTETGWTTYTANFVVEWATTQTTEAEDISAKGHTEETIPAVSATCTETGLTAGVKCSVCDEVLTAQQPTNALGHNMTKHDAAEPTCTATGNNEYHSCDRCNKVFKDEAGVTETTVAKETINALGHNMTKHDAAEPTCTATGNKEYYTCDRCNKVFKDEAGVTETTVAKETINALGHDLATVAAKAATCTDIGWNAYEYCKREGCDHTTYSELAALGHSMTKTEAKDATCTATGNNAYHTCNTCKKVFKDEAGVTETTVAAETIAAIGHSYDEGKVTTAPTCTGKGVKTFTCQNDHSHTYTESIDALGHAPKYVKAKAPTCIEAGYKEHYKCSRENCGVLFLDEAGTTTTTEAALVVNAKGHTEVVDAAVAATCTKTGLTAGKHCSVCDEILVAQTVVDALGHTEVTDEAVAPTCTATGLTEGSHCSVCNEVLVAQTVVDALGHTEVTDEAVAPTCTATGLTEGSHCSVCDEVLVAQKTVEVLAHTEVIDEAVDPTCTATGLTEGKHCSVCNTVLVAQKTVTQLGHSYTAAVTSPTCTEGGYTTYTCSRCDNSYTANETSATGHSFSAVWTTDASNHWHQCYCGEKSDVAAHTDETTKDHKCDTCDRVVSECADSDDADHKCDHCGKDGITDHVFGTEWKHDETNHWHECACGAKSDVAAHADKTTKDHKCDTCDRVVSECADSDDADHKCDHCGKDGITGHVYGTEWKNDASNHWHECACGAKSDVAAHADKTTKDHKCDTCGYVMSECADSDDADHKCDHCGKDGITGHVYGTEWKNDASNHWHECACGAKSDVAAHADKTTKDHKCDTCGYVMSECADSDDADHKCDHCGKDGITDHVYGTEWKNDASNHWHECACGAKSDEAAHADGDDKNHDCDECGATDIEDHTAGEAVVEDQIDATCGKAGSYNSVVYCSECGEKLSSTSETIPATGNHVDGDDKNHDCDECGATDIEGHTAGEAVVEDQIDATCGKAGSYNSVVYCSECGEKLSSTPETIPTTGNHVDGDDKNHDCDECGATDIEGHTAGNAVVENKIDATCGKAGSYNSVVYCSECGEKLSTTTVTIPATGNHADGDDTDHNCDTCGEEIASCHSYTLDTGKGENGYKWSDDGKTCTAYGMCSCGATTAVNGTISSAVKTPATCAEMGWTTYTATFEGVTGATAQTKDVQDIPVADHAWGEPTYTDNEDGTHTASYICSVDATHTKTDDPVEHTYVDGFCACGAEGELIVYVASVNGTMYETLAEAVAAANSGDTVTLLGDATGAGVVIDKSITIDFGGYTYTVNSAVGSSGDETLGLQILAGNTVTLKNGTLTANDELNAQDKVTQVLVMNSANLNVEDMTLTGNENTLYALSNNSGTVNITGATNIDAKNGVAFNACQYEGYEAPVVNVDTTGMITGKIEVSEEISTNLNISGGTFTVEIAQDWCAEGFEPMDNGDGTYGVTKKSGEDHTHIPGEAVVENKIEATCSKDGSYNSVVYCTDCGEKLSGTYKVIPATGNHIDGDDQDHDCDTCGKENVSSHDYVKVLDRKEATCTEDGYELRACVCGEEYREVLAALGHKDLNDDNLCDGCGKSMLRGDLDLDGDVDAEDLTLLARHVGGIELLTGLALHNADVDLNGDVNADDLTLHARYVGGIIRDWSEGLGTAEE